MTSEEHWRYFPSPVLQRAAAQLALAPARPGARLVVSSPPTGGSAMQKMVKFKLSRECREIAVNPAKVLYVSHYDHGATSVHFGKECFVRVKGRTRRGDAPAGSRHRRGRRAGRRALVGVQTGGRASELTVTPTLLPPAGEGGPAKRGRMRGHATRAARPEERPLDPFPALNGQSSHPTRLRRATFSRKREKGWRYTFARSTAAGWGNASRGTPNNFSRSVPSA